ncbi:twin-arginine translocase subunit TatC [Kroppenstedtia eburnea]|uniref:Sec-independent protein translocase protein TatC n=1 Tax=Kroppenstedtia eburnea TaxID=714067 RepID=A0A1N7P102_9BACL|nr:twin-arginine translocase subunit TatC [Kroppenstedtia eburnea]EGK09154.1 sec-independent protein translocase TatC [Desmospora sp. 8437]QKI80894.1 twin-arginine translocase subunit TatC [Kroppenstedtia eburnea]SIT04247.1 sec-independent protein translocase protein TatC [Kroppenstedtia eburnea]
MSGEEQKHWTEHLGELRSRILLTLATFIIMLVVGFLFAQPMIHFMKEDLLQGSLEETLQLHIFSPGEALSIYMQFAFVAAVTFTLPIALYQAWAFVRPGLTSREQRATLRYIPSAVLLFIVGLLFGYYWIFPFLLNFMFKLTASLGATETYGMYEFFRFMFRVVFPIAVFFEMPVVILFLTRIRLLNPHLLRKGRRFAYLIMVVLAALVTPPDFVSNILVTIPLILLYEVSIWLSARVYRRIEAEDEERERRWREREKADTEDGW